MATEIERKYRIEKLGSLELRDGLEIEQGYLCTGGVTVRVRTKGPRAFLTIKGTATVLETASGSALQRDEFEYEIPTADAEQLLRLAETRLQKTRYLLDNALEIDIFKGRLEGLILAEFESPDGAAPPVVPGLVWRDVTTDHRYSNSWLARNGLPPEETDTEPR